MNFGSRQTTRAPSPQHEGANIQQGGIFYGWWIVFGSAVGLFWGVPITVYCFSVFLKLLMQEFHVGRTAVSLGFTLHLVTGAFSAPLIGWLIDRCGSRKVILIGTATFALILLVGPGLCLSIRHFYLFCVLLGLALHSAGPLPYGNIVSRWFDRRRGLALGLMLLGIGLGAVFMPWFAQHLIARFGWRAAYSILGGAALIVAVPTVGLF